MYTVQLTEKDIELIKLSFKQSSGWLQDQKGQLEGALMGFSKIDSICKDMYELTERLSRDCRPTPSD